MVDRLLHELGGVLIDRSVGELRAKSSYRNRPLTSAASPTNGVAQCWITPGHTITRAIIAVGSFATSAFLDHNWRLRGPAPRVLQ